MPQQPAQRFEVRSQSLSNGRNVTFFSQQNIESLTQQISNLAQIITIDRAERLEREKRLDSTTALMSNPPNVSQQQFEQLFNVLTTLATHMSTILAVNGTQNV